MIKILVSKKIHVKNSFSIIIFFSWIQKTEFLNKSTIFFKMTEKHKYKEKKLHKNNKRKEFNGRIIFSIKLIIVKYYAQIISVFFLNQIIIITKDWAEQTTIEDWTIFHNKSETSLKPENLFVPRLFHSCVDGNLGNLERF